MSNSKAIVGVEPSRLGLAHRSALADIEREHLAAEHAAAKAIQHASNCGRHLIHLKAEMSHGTWGDFVKAHLPFTPQTASGYMRIAKAVEDGTLQIESASSIRGALKQLSSPRELADPLVAPESDDEPPADLDDLNRAEWYAVRAEEEVRAAGAGLVRYADEIDSDDPPELREAARRYGHLLQAQPEPWGDLSEAKEEAKIAFQALLREQEGAA